MLASYRELRASHGGPVISEEVLGEVQGFDYLDFELGLGVEECGMSEECTHMYDMYGRGEA